MALFHDAFCSLIETSDLVSSLAVCVSNHAEAWDLLTARNKIMRVMVGSHIKALMSIGNAVKETAKGINQVLNIILQHVGALRAMERPVEFWDNWLIYQTVSKLVH